MKKASFSFIVEDVELHDVKHMLTIDNGIVIYRLVRENLYDPEKSNTRLKEKLYSKQSFDIIHKQFIGKDVVMTVGRKRYSVRLDIDGSSIIVSDNSNLNMLATRCNRNTTSKVEVRRGKEVMRIEIKSDGMTKKKWMGLRKKKILKVRKDRSTLNK